LSDAIVAGDAQQARAAMTRHVAGSQASLTIQGPISAGLPCASRRSLPGLVVAECY
jgi:hypothetical protein